MLTEKPVLQVFLLIKMNYSEDNDILYCHAYSSVSKMILCNNKVSIVDGKYQTYCDAHIRNPNPKYVTYNGRCPKRCKVLMRNKEPCRKDSTQPEGVCQDHLTLEMLCNRDPK